jgi:dethiobiotin synthetase
MKPVATGCRADAPDRGNEDISMLIAASNVRAPIELINPYCFLPPVAPHLAAEQSATLISFERVDECYRSLTALADRVVVEGAGGLLVPLGAEQDFAHLARHLELSIVLVVGMRLGCLNHALLTAQAVRHRGLPFAGWVANCIEADMPLFEENLQTLKRRLAAPLIGVVPFGPDQAQACAAIDPNLLATGA